MIKVIRNNKGFAGVEALLIVVIVAVVAGTGFYVFHAKHTSDKVLSAANHETAANAPAAAKATTSTTATSSDPTLTSDMNNVNASLNQSNQDAANSNSALNDSQSEVTVPTN
jgi:uncharacterized protein (UPF0333 family)